ncbi:FHA domain-containing protein [Paraburkholderia sp. JPY432]|uniref:FHA domain-containing protein n=1 Tax=Paraburkholderia youngii TaxID=2782701 RepID=UPI001595E9EA|nr:FHA domain-containing protein [Paraburkholderia youngii]NVH74238.1 FHA domain-containing protein [Paraburkholderia youngii]
MNTGNLWQRLTALVKSRGEPGSGRTCPVGHPMDPQWSTCPLCEAEQQAHQPTAPLQDSQRPVTPSTAKLAAGQPAPPPVNEAVRDAPAPSEPGVISAFAASFAKTRREPMVRQPTQVSGATDTPSDPARRDTPASVDTAAAATQPAAGRRITGALVTYTWQPQGQLFPLYEGRNVIGRGDIASEGRPCDVHITSDPKLSNEHAILLWRRDAGHFELVDNLSTNGTFVSEREIGRDSAHLADGDQFVAGGTRFLLKQFDAAPAKAAARGGKNDKAASPDRPRPPPKRKIEPADDA